VKKNPERVEVIYSKIKESRKELTELKQDSESAKRTVQFGLV